MLRRRVWGCLVLVLLVFEAGPSFAQELVVTPQVHACAEAYLNLFLEPTHYSEPATGGAYLTWLAGDPSSPCAGLDPTLETDPTAQAMVSGLWAAVRHHSGEDPLELSSYLDAQRSVAYLADVSPTGANLVSVLAALDAHGAGRMLERGVVPTHDPTHAALMGMVLRGLGDDAPVPDPVPFSIDRETLVRLAGLLPEGILETVTHTSAYVSDGGYSALAAEVGRDLLRRLPLCTGVDALAGLLALHGVEGADVSLLGAACEPAQPRALTSEEVAYIDALYEVQSLPHEYIPRLRITAGDPLQPGAPLTIGADVLTLGSHVVSRRPEVGDTDAPIDLVAWRIEAQSALDAEIAAAGPVWSAVASRPELSLQLVIDAGVLWADVQWGLAALQGTFPEVTIVFGGPLAARDLRQMQAGLANATTESTFPSFPRVTLEEAAAQAEALEAGSGLGTGQSPLAVSVDPETPQETTSGLYIIAVPLGGPPEEVLQAYHDHFEALGELVFIPHPRVILEPAPDATWGDVSNTMARVLRLATQVDLTAMVYLRM